MRRARVSYVFFCPSNIFSFFFHQSPHSPFPPPSPTTQQSLLGALFFLVRVILLLSSESLSLYLLLVSISDGEMEEVSLDDIEERYELREAAPMTPSTIHKGHFEFELAGPGELELLGVSDERTGPNVVEPFGSATESEENEAEVGPAGTAESVTSGGGRGAASSTAGGTPRLSRRGSVLSVRGGKRWRIK